MLFLHIAANQDVFGELPARRPWGYSERRFLQCQTTIVQNLLLPEEHAANTKEERYPHANFVARTSAVILIVLNLPWNVPLINNTLVSNEIAHTRNQGAYATFIACR